jgi:hypothetical protein
VIRSVAIGHLSPGQRVKRGRSGRITEDDPRWNSEDDGQPSRALTPAHRGRHG